KLLSGSPSSSGGAWRCGQARSALHNSLTSEAVAKKFAVHPRLFGEFPKGKKSPIERSLASAFDSALEEIRQGLEAKQVGTGAQHPAAVFGQAQIRATPKQAMRLRAQIEGLMKKVRRESRDQGIPIASWSSLLR